MTTKQLRDLALIAVISSPMLLMMASPATAQEVTTQSAATNVNATGSEIAPPFVTLPGGSTVQTFSTSGVQAVVDSVAATVNQQLAAGTLVPTDLPANIVPSSGLNSEIVSNVLGGDTASVATLENLLSNAIAQGTATPVSGVPPSELIQNLVEALEGLTADSQVDAGQLEQAVDAYNAAIAGVTDAAYLSNPPGPLLTIRAALSQLIAASGTSPDAQPGAEGN